MFISGDAHRAQPRKIPEWNETKLKTQFICFLHDFHPKKLEKNVIFERACERKFSGEQ